MKSFIKIALITFTSCWSCLFIYGQQFKPTSICATDQLLKVHREDSKYAETETITEKHYQNKINSSQNKSSDSLLILPVVVHIIHNNGLENITDDQVYQCLTNLNDAFRNVNYYNPLTGTDTNIEFCLAKRGPDGNATNGIIRYVSPMTDMSAPHSHSEVANLATWDTRSYINIRLVKEACLENDCSSVAGYAYLPYAHGWLGDGIVMEAGYFGADPDNSVVAIHEMGHYLGLLHTFAGGCKNNDCLSDGDRVCDTPPDNITGLFPCDLAINSCQTDPDDPSANNPFRSTVLGGMGDQNDMHRNYLDYNNHICRDRFSTGQKERMRYFIENVRSSLLLSKACLPPCPANPIAFFTADQMTIEAGQQITVTNQSINSNTFNWYINGVWTSGTMDATFTLHQEGLYTLRLEAWNNMEECDWNFHEIEVMVTCPVFSDFDYNTNGDWLVFTDESSNANMNQWTIKDGPGNLLYSSTNGTDSLNISGLEFVQLCLLSKNDYCEDQHCEYIQLTADGSEICNNELDDDGDGMVDLYDPDCPCNDTAFQAFCPIDCEYLPDSFPEFEMKLKWASEVIVDLSSRHPSPTVGDIDGDGIIEIVSPKIIGESGIGVFSDKNVIIINGSNGQTELDFDHHERNIGRMVSIADTDRNGKSELYSLQWDTILCHDTYGNLLWQSEKLINYPPGQFVNIADFNGDGISELYAGNEIVNSQNGIILLAGNGGEGCQSRNTVSHCSFKHTIAADVLPHPGLELIAGNTVYEIEINNLTGMIGNTITPIIAPPPVEDGVTSIGDIDGDGELDVVVVRGNDHPSGGGIWVWNPRTLNILASAPAGNVGGVPFIGDVTGDCLPEIGMTFEHELRMYQYDGTDQLKLLYNLPTTDGSGFTGITMFDFNQDGKQELVYRDETNLRIIEGSTGNTLASYPLASGTGLEYPIVADVDNDGEAEIIIHGDENNSNKNLRIYCFESATTPWAPARSVWNQYGYHVTNVNDDLTIPRQQQNQAAHLEGHEDCLRTTCPAPYNAFLAQATYRTQEGCVQFPAADLSVAIIDYECSADSFTVCIEVTNTGDRAITEPIDMGCYPFNPVIIDAPPIETATISSLDTTLCFTSAFPVIWGQPWLGWDSLYVAINAPYMWGAPLNFDYAAIPECDFSNNLAFVVTDLDSLALDLGPDITKCESEVITLNAGTGFESYQWSDGTVDSIYSSSFEGQHFVTATDVCGRIYTDTMQVNIDPINEVDLGADRQVCPTETMQVNLSGDYDFIQWLPADQVDCPDCMEVVAQSDTSFTLMVVVGKENCYSSDTLSFFIKEKTELTDSRSLCEGDTLQLMGEALTTAGLYEFDLNGCDSFLLLDLTVLPRDTTQTEQQICMGDSILFAGNYLKNSGLYTAATTNANGCDSLLFLDLSVVENIAESDTLSFCAGDSVQVFGQWITKDTLVSEAFTSIAGCDSVQSFWVNALPLPYLPVHHDLCTGDSVKVGDELLSAAGFYEIKIAAQSGCDSIFGVTVEELPYVSQLDTLIVCENDSVEVFGQWVSEETVVSETFQSAVGCDSTQSFQVLTTPLPQHPLHFDICKNDSLSYGNQWFTSAGFYEITLSAAAGCDTVFEITIEEIPLSSQLDTLYLCEGDSIEIFGEWVDGDGFFSEMFTDVSGCDSMQSFQVLTSALIHQPLTFQLCMGDSVEVAGEWLTGAGAYQVTANAANGCDTIYEVAITELPTEENVDSLSLCEGDSIWLFGDYVNAAGTWSEVSTGSNGCDSTQVFFVEMENTFATSDEVVLCPGDSIFINNQWFHAPSETAVMATAANGCDSVHTVFITELPPPNPPTAEVDCHNLQITANITAPAPWQITWSNGDTAPQTIYQDTGTAVVSLFAEPNCEMDFFLTLPVLPDTAALSDQSDQSLNEGQSLSIDLGLDADEWQVQWSPSAVFTCDTCLQTEILPTGNTTVEAVFTHSSGCTYTNGFQITVQPKGGLFIPNAFSPNGDGNNDVWRVFPSDDQIVLEEVLIFGRWGNMVASWQGPGVFSWDGTANGKPLDAGVFVFYIKYRDVNGQAVEAKGDVVLVR